MINPLKWIFPSCFTPHPSGKQNSILPIESSLSMEQPKNGMDTKHPPKGGSILQSMYHSVRELWHESAAYKEELNRTLPDAGDMIVTSTLVGALFFGVGAVPGLIVGCLGAAIRASTPTILSSLYLGGGLMYRSIKATAKSILATADDVYAKSCTQSALNKINNATLANDLTTVLSTIPTKTFQTQEVQNAWKEKYKQHTDGQLLPSWLQKDPSSAIEYVCSLNEPLPECLPTLIKDAIPTMTKDTFLSFFRACNNKPQFMKILQNPECYAAIQTKINTEKINTVPDVQAILYTLQPDKMEKEKSSSFEKLPSAISAFVSLVEEKVIDKDIVMQVKARLPYLMRIIDSKDNQRLCDNYIRPLWDSLSIHTKQDWLKDPAHKRVRKDLGVIFPTDTAAFEIDLATKPKELEDLFEAMAVAVFSSSEVLETIKKQTLTEKMVEIWLQKSPQSAIEYLVSANRTSLVSLEVIQHAIANMDKNQFISFLQTCDKNVHFVDHLKDIGCYDIIRERIFQEENFFVVTKEVSGAHFILYNLQTDKNNQPGDKSSLFRVLSARSAFIAFEKKASSQNNTVLEAEENFFWLIDALYGKYNIKWSKDQLIESLQNFRDSYMLPIWNSLNLTQKIERLNNPIFQKINKDLENIFTLATTERELEGVFKSMTEKDFSSKEVLKAIEYQLVASDSQKKPLKLTFRMLHIWMEKNPTSALQFLNRHTLKEHDVIIKKVILHLSDTAFIAFLKAYNENPSLQNTELSTIICERFCALHKKTLKELLEKDPDVHLILYSLGVYPTGRPIYAALALIAYAQKGRVPLNIISTSKQQLDKSYEDARDRHKPVDENISKPIINYITTHSNALEDPIYQNILLALSPDNG